MKIFDILRGHKNRATPDTGEVAHAPTQRVFNSFACDVSQLETFQDYIKLAESALAKDNIQEAAKFHSLSLRLLHNNQASIAFFDEYAKQVAGQHFYAIVQS